MAKEITRVFIVIPCFKVSEQIESVIKRIDLRTVKVVVVDDCCPEGSGKKIEKLFSEDNLKVLYSERNLGVGGATKKGFEYALQHNADVVIKLDGDGQAPPEKIEELISPIRDGIADYVTGNRFTNLETLFIMPKIRLLGNIILSFMAKMSTGYWKLFDPNNGFVAIDSATLKKIPLYKIDNGYFFESDMLFRLNLLEARIKQIPMDSFYGNEKSNLSIGRTTIEFSYKHIRNTIKRINYWYFIKDFGIASISLMLGAILTLCSIAIGFYSWGHSIETGIETKNGTQILVAILFLSGLNLIISFLNYDIRRTG